MVGAASCIPPSLGVTHGCLIQTTREELLELLPATDHTIALGEVLLTPWKDLSDLQQSIFCFCPARVMTNFYQGSLTVQRLGVASQQEEESGLIVTPLALASSRLAWKMVDLSVQLDPRSAELRCPRATQVGPVLPVKEGQPSGDRSALQREHGGGGARS